MAVHDISINGRKVQAQPGTTILEAARENGIAIPTLCSHEALAPYGACRLCIVEVTQNSSCRITTSCTTEIQQGMVIRTDTARLRSIRTTLVQLLLEQAPGAPVVRDLARDMGIPAGTTDPSGPASCIMCGLCVRTCAEIVGAHALSFARKGAKREVAVPFFRDSRECIGCGACAFVCPTGFIKMHDVLDCGQPERIMETWKTRLALQACVADGLPFAPRAMLEHFVSRYPTPEGFLESCAQCRRQNKKT
ncbi:MAG: (2Fe-2S)-binding protein [Deltaproteobacteria bacterium]|nr:(2Fe-2S)-binding protein [Deltaproteobacteria bacterium]